MLTILSFLLILMVLVMAHELGHLIAAKRLGIRVETFSIGFGPKIVRIRKGETDYVICLVPLGGYVQLGEAVGSGSFRADSPHYSERPPLHKIIVALAGPCANLVLAVIVLSIVSIIGMDSPVFLDRPADVGWVAPGSPSEKAGIRSGDRIVEIDGNRTGSWRDAVRLIPIYEKSRSTVKIVRDGTPSVLSLSDCSRLNSGLAPAERIVVGTVAPGSPAEKAGLKAGDIIRHAGSQPLTAWAQFQERVSTAGHDLVLLADRGGKAEELRVTPTKDPKTGKKTIGISQRQELKKVGTGLFGSLRYGFVRTEEIFADSLGTFRALLTGSLSLKALGGPVAIAQASGSTAKAGLVPLLSFLAFMSIQLGVFNLLPFIPIVDGGQVTLFLFEMFRQRPLSVLSLERIAKAGWAAMGVIILFVTYNDVMKLF